MDEEEEDEDEEEEDVARYVDVVSLYPSCMRYSPYPVGAYHEITEPEGLQQVKQEIASWAFVDPLIPLTPREHIAQAAHQICRFAAVDVTWEAPNDLLIPYLFARDADGHLRMTLESPTRGVYAGPDLWEAVLLGYRILEVHRVVLFAKASANVFGKFIQTLYDLKRKSQKGTPMYTTAKLGQNAVSGKMSQQVIDMDTRFLVGLRALRDFLAKEHEEPVMHLEPLHLPTLMTDDQEEPARATLEVRNQRLMQEAWAVHMYQPDAPFTKPTQLGATILAWSRVHMSRIVRLIGGYRNPDRLPKYTDTDSLVITQEAYKILERSRLLIWNLPITMPILGKGLGQLDDELGGRHIIRAVFLAPKTYALYHRAPGATEVQCLVRCKGIPHPGQSFVVVAENGEEDLGACLDRENALHYLSLDHPNQIPNLKRVLYVLLKKGPEYAEDEWPVHIPAPWKELGVQLPLPVYRIFRLCSNPAYCGAYTRLNVDLFRRVYADNLQVIAVYVVLKRHLFQRSPMSALSPPSPTGSIDAVFCTRALSRSLFWDRGVRYAPDMLARWSVPHGHWLWDTVKSTPSVTPSALPTRFHA